MIAVLPGGHWYPGTVKSGRGFAVKAWMVGYPINKGAHLVFRDASGKTVATLGTSGPDGPPQFPQPRSGGVTAFKYPAGDLTGPGGRVTAYLVQGRVGFWSAPSGGKISPVPAAGPPALGGLILPFGQRSGENHPEIEEGFGYAHANVTRVVLYLPGGRTVSASTFAAGWSGSDLRLWAVGLPPTATSTTLPWRRRSPPPGTTPPGTSSSGSPSAARLIPAQPLAATGVY